MRRIICLFLGVSFLVASWCCRAETTDHSSHVPILVYHNFHSSKSGSMTITTQRFLEQLTWLRENNYTVIPLKELVSYLQKKINSLPPKPVVITIDDGRESVYQYALPIILKYKIPVTLFIYPMVISHASYALTWEQLKELQKTGLFDIEGHTYWHPNFKQEKKRLSEAAYQKFVSNQLVRSKAILDEKLGIHVTLLAWPFGIHDNFLHNAAEKAGYTMAFSIGARDASRAWPAMGEPRFMIVEGQTMKTFQAIMTHKFQ